MEDKRHIRKPIYFDDFLKDHNFIQFEVPGEPFAKQRPRATKKGRYITIYTPRETKNYEEKVRKYYNRSYRGVMLDGDITVDVEGIFSIPKSVSKKKANDILINKLPHTKKPDCDNMAKVCLDALNGLAYPDDAQINRLNISKEYGENAMIKIMIKENRKKGDIK